ncbi:hypothetical protein HAX54_005499 [Datura stramonium]|uniref:Uncharacterized protein n=1 Tax=Datura stramonium TaxID=4076 RepID=A0ABS8WXE5_DATST|nr:hypothetical protein [Datura stramonium]
MTRMEDANATFTGSIQIKANAPPGQRESGISAALEEKHQGAGKKNVARPSKTTPRDPGLPKLSKYSFGFDLADLAVVKRNIKEGLQIFTYQGGTIAQGRALKRISQ